tara:strand:+ start:13396 stop:15039 length:1644 start_codon:yes stop_codon:yes gene_type:complete
MPGGEMNLIVEGNQNVILNGNPTKTFFTSVYKKYTNFGMQKFRLDYEGLRELKLSQESIFNFKVKRYADLFADTYLCVTLPNIYSPVYPFDCTGSDGVWVPYEFQWIKYLGFLMIKEIEIYNGGLTLQKVTGDYLYAMYLRDMGSFTPLVDEMIGNIADLNDPANSGIRSNTYPNAVYTDGSTPEPSIRSSKLFVPLNLWFCLNKQQALPLCALQYNEIELRITLRPISELFTIRDVTDATNNYPRIAPNFNVSEHAFYRFIQEPVDPETNTYSNKTTSWNQDIHLLSKYIFLSDEEKSIFTAYDHKYLFKEVHSYTFNNIAGTAKEKIQTAGLVSDWMMIFKRSDVSARNEWTNYTNWTYNYLPSDLVLASETGTLCSDEYGPGLNQDNTSSNLYSTGLYASENEKIILKSLGILIDGEYREHVFDERVYRLTEPYLSSPQPSYAFNANIYCYNFCLNTDPFNLQPSGAVNLSKYYDIELEINTITPPLDSDATFNTICDPITNEVIGIKKPRATMYEYTYDLVLLEHRYNILEISNGTCSLMYAR